MGRQGLRAALAACCALWCGVAVACGALWCGSAVASGLEVVEATPSELTARLTQAEAGRVYRVTLEHDGHRFVWENLIPDEEGIVRLKDDRHLRPEHRLRCESRVSPADPVIFDDLLKGAVVGKRRRRFGVPVSTFGGPGYLVPGVTDLRRDEFGSFWLYLDRPPYAILKYDEGWRYQFALLAPGRVLAYDVDAEGNLYLLHPGNWISKHGPLGEALGAWELPVGREPGGFVSASGLAIDREGEYIYLADEVLGRVQRFGLDLELRPYRQTAWGWIGREDLAYRRAGSYDAGSMYYQLDRPRQIRLDGKGRLLVSCEHYVSRFDLATGLQVDFGRNPVLGWGGTFTDSAFSRSAGLDGHWQRHWLAGVDGLGNIYIADRENEFVVDPRLQVFDSDGVLVRTFDIEDEVRDEAGRPVHIRAVMGLAAAEDRIWLVDAAGRAYESRGGLRSGGRLYLGPGAAGRQFDLAQAAASEFEVEAQAGRVKHRWEGAVMAYPAGESETDNCEGRGRTVLANGETSMWTPARLGEPFRVSLFESAGEAIPSAQCLVEFEEEPGLFGTQYDYFRVTNRSGREWEGVRFVAETVE